MVYNNPTSKLVMSFHITYRKVLKYSRQWTIAVHATQHVAHVLDVKTEACNDMCVKPQPLTSKHIQDKYITSLSR